MSGGRWYLTDSPKKGSCPYPWATDPFSSPENDLAPHSLPRVDLGALRVQSMHQQRRKAVSYAVKCEDNGNSGAQTMDSIEQLTTFFGWCTVINFGILILGIVLQRLSRMDRRDQREDVRRAQRASKGNVFPCISAVPISVGDAEYCPLSRVGGHGLGVAHA